MKKVLITLLSLVFLIMSCSDDSNSNPTSSGGDDTTVIINASSHDTWAYFNFSTGQVIDIQDPQTSTEWDIAFKRMKIKTNSGLSGPGEGGVIDMMITEFDSVKTAPAGNYFADDVVALTMGETDEYYGSKVLEKWYRTEGGMPPTIISYENVYVIKKNDGTFAKMQILSYYNDANSSGYITMKYENNIEEGNEIVLSEKEITIDATSSEEWVYFSFVTGEYGEIVEVNDPENSSDWDIAFQRFKIKTNSGTSTLTNGQGQGAYNTEMTFEEVTDVPQDVIYTVDEIMEEPMNPGAFYTGNPVIGNWYEMGQGGIVSKNDTFILNYATGDYVKVQITDYYNEENVSGYITMRYDKNIRYVKELNK